jgi:hypothetical protein
MIISASYKTDIPTFYGEWFMNRLRARYCKMVNPYGRQVYTVDLSPGVVDGFVFWTKNIGPFLKYLPEIRERGYPFIVQHTLNGYPRELESRVTNYQQTLEHIRQFAAEYGPERLVWRYDPILFTSLMPPDWHRDNFAQLAARLEGTIDEVVISFAQVYRKTERNVEAAAQQFGFSWQEHRQEDYVLQVGRELAADLAQVAGQHGMRLKICSQKAFLIAGVVEEARCVDAERLERVAGCTIEGKAHQKGNRKECGCFAARDIGEYDTCPHGCVYCYAVQRRDLALQRYKQHDPHAEFLFAPEGAVLVEPAATPAIAVTQVQRASHTAKRKRQAADSEQGKLF